MQNKQEIILNQSSLQDLIECPRRFQLRTIDQLSWPASLGEPLSKYEHLIEIGNHFHTLCHRFFTGIDSDTLTESISDPDLLKLWKGFSPLGDELIKFRSYPEIVLATSVDEIKITAKFDLILREDDSSIRIYDWKTSANTPAKTILASRAQTILYPFLLVEAGKNLVDLPTISPSELSMIYFYPLSPEDEIVFNYSSSKHQENEKQIIQWINEIKKLSSIDGPYPLTENLSHCKSCVYRAICDRGISAADVNELEDIEQEDLSNSHFDLGQIIEIDY